MEQDDVAAKAPEETLQCGICSLLLKRIDRVVVFNKGLRAVCDREGCAITGCNDSPCFNCGKKGAYFFSTKSLAFAGAERKPGDPSTTLYFPFCSTDCAVESRPKTETFIKGTLGSERTYITGRVCKNCGKADSEMMICSGCRMAWYCEVSCQKANWSLHKSICQQFAVKPRP